MSKRDFSRRKYFMHAAHPTIGVARGVAAIQACQSAASFDATHQSTRPLRVCLFADPTPAGTGDSLAALKACLASHSIRCSRAFSTANDRVRGFEKLDRCDCMVLLGPTMMTGEPLEQIDRFCRHGGAVLGLDAVGDSLESCSVFQRKLLGVDCAHRDDRRTLPVVRAAAAAEHPVLYGIDDFVAQVALYHEFRLAPDANVLLTAATADHRRQPVAWVRSHQGARIFCTSLGHEADWQMAAFRRLVRMALSWATRPAM